MSIQASTVESTTNAKAAIKLTDKYNRYVVLVYKLLNELKSGDIINAKDGASKVKITSKMKKIMCMTVRRKM